ncbi:MAG TPA: hypothetical protein VGP31_18710 [Planosporangium sp.]|nr:hypothetical protein [Planosporangium sp.]
MSEAFGKAFWEGHIATTALRRAREHTETLGAGITSRIDWLPADLTIGRPPRNTSTWSPPTTYTRRHRARRCSAGSRHRSRLAARCSSSATAHDGHEITMCDAVLRAHKRP